MEKSSRPVRNRRHSSSSISRRAWPPGDNHRPVKRLFTPEIKRMLKDWLVRRRDNPYPSRDEKKTLAHDTGLTYTQICNWFANWRRKLKNSGREPSKKTWGHLIKNYNVNAKGNVEQFSICSNDSIWGDNERSSQLSISPSYSGNYDHYESRDDCRMYNNNNNNNINNNNLDYYQNEYNEKPMNFSNNCPIDVKYYKDCTIGTPTDHCYTPRKLSQAQCFHISSTTDEFLIEGDIDGRMQFQQLGLSSKPKYKQQMMEKYLRDTNNKSSSPELSKWLESAANFTPNKNNYIEWNSSRAKSDRRRPKSSDLNQLFDDSIHQKEELDAAEALANLACNYRQRLINSANL